jgi:hypothetical protein
MNSVVPKIWESRRSLVDQRQISHALHIHCSPHPLVGNSIFGLLSQLKLLLIPNDSNFFPEMSNAIYIKLAIRIILLK